MSKSSRKKGNQTVAPKKLYLPYCFLPILILGLYQFLMKRVISVNQGLIIENITANPAGPLLRPFLRPRVPGSEGSLAVQSFLIHHFHSTLGWHLEKDTFTTDTPLRDGGSRKTSFTNLIFTKNPKASRRLVLAAHYDSKPWVADQQFDGQFIGATDSAWPCALISELGRALNDQLSTDADLSLQMIFFDGEEAHVNWNPEDSLYGSRHLADKWQREGKLGGIEVLVLLDLLGASNPTIYSFNHQGANDQFARLASIEAEFRLRGLVKSSSVAKPLFSLNRPTSSVDDDHVPFMTRGVPILHLIPLPFPSVWHSVRDDESALDNQVIHDFTRVMYQYLLEYPGLVSRTKVVE